ncbi:MAG: dependent ligase [Devosia sp.]|nr:dependent ligase [Devosia sp.]
MSRLDFVPPMEAKLVSDLPSDDGWQFEPKWDGFRCIASKEGDAVELWAKSGKSLGRYFPEVLDFLKNLPAPRLMIDGELMVSIDGAPSFDALQQRLHPAASRVRKLAVETPAKLIAFDLLHEGDVDWSVQPLSLRRAALEALLEATSSIGDLRLSPTTLDPEIARKWFAELSVELDGVIAKRRDEAYASGKRAMLKIKRTRTADCVVGGFRYLADRPEVGSLLLGLFNVAGTLDHVGFTSGISDDERPELTKRLEKLVGPPGFTGNAPGGPSRWSTERSAEWQPLRHELVVEVRYDQITGDRFRHGTRLERWRPDKAPQQCMFDQLATPVGADSAVRSAIA